jgi:hypothetical protein
MEASYRLLATQRGEGNYKGGLALMMIRAIQLAAEPVRRTAAWGAKRGGVFHVFLYFAGFDIERLSD